MAEARDISDSDQAIDNIHAKRAKLFIMKILNIEAKVNDDQAFEQMSDLEIEEWQKALGEHEANFDKEIMELICN